MKDLPVSAGGEEGQVGGGEVVGLAELHLLGGRAGHRTQDTGHSLQPWSYILPNCLQTITLADNASRFLITIFNDFIEQNLKEVKQFVHIFYRLGLDK